MPHPRWLWTTTIAGHVRLIAGLNTSATRTTLLLAVPW
jgi:hypothetical protein